MAERSDPRACRICGERSTSLVLRRASVPVHQHLVYASPAEARAAPRGELEMRACTSCGFVFNPAFDPRLLAYGAAYDNRQDFSPAFVGYLDHVVERLVGRPELQSGRHVVEVGCGKGTFLELLIRHPAAGARGTGFDPSYTGPDTALGGRLRFEKTEYERQTAVAANLTVARHVIEHVPEPLELLVVIRETCLSGSRVALETPSVDWILRNAVVWDFFYEHCSLFSPRSLDAALAAAGFGDTTIEHVFGDQYLWAESIAGARSTVARRREGQIGAQLDFARRTSDLTAMVHELATPGPTFVWGAGAKGATFCDLVDPDSTVLAGVIDLNPAKQGRFLAGTGHPILTPERAVGLGMMTTIVLNPHYTGEVAELLGRLGSRAAVCDAMADLLPCA